MDLMTVNDKLPIYVVEGPFDSTFINNSVALCGSDGDLFVILREASVILVYDNEPRNKEIVNRRIRQYVLIEVSKVSSSGQTES